MPRKSQFGLNHVEYDLCVRCEDLIAENPVFCSDCGEGPLCNSCAIVCDWCMDVLCLDCKDIHLDYHAQALKNNT